MKIDSSAYIYINSAEWGEVILLKKAAFDALVQGDAQAKAELSTVRSIPEDDIDVMSEFFREWLTSVMEKYDVSQHELAKLASTTQPYISNLITNTGNIPKAKVRNRIKNAIIDNYIKAGGD